MAQSSPLQSALEEAEQQSRSQKLKQLQNWEFFK